MKFLIDNALSPFGGRRSAAGWASVILFRRASQRRPKSQVALLLANLPNVADALEQGSIIVFEETRVRIHLLPVGGKE